MIHNPLGGIFEAYKVHPKKYAGKRDHDGRLSDRAAGHRVDAEQVSRL